MLVVWVHNDGRGTDDAASYEWTVEVNAALVASGDVGGHNRADGWPALLRLIADAGEQRDSE